jgi:hypothetical protein
MVDVGTLSVAELKSRLRQANIPHSDCIEKEDLVKRLKAAEFPDEVTPEDGQELPPVSQSMRGDSIGDSDDNALLGGGEFATGLNPKSTTCSGVSAICCPKCCCKRVGHMIILCESKDKHGKQRFLDCQRHHKIADDKSICFAGARQLNCMCGPCWPVVTFFTLPAIIFVGIFASSMWRPCHCIPPFLQFLYWFFFLLPVCGLAYTAYTDPGILRRHRERPDPSWNYSDQAETYRPPKAVYVAEADCVMEDFDHVCPWTGTAIAKKNTRSFYVFFGGLIAFLLFTCVVMVYKDANTHQAVGPPVTFRPPNQNPHGDMRPEPHPNQHHAPLKKMLRQPAKLPTPTPTPLIDTSSIGN